MDNRKATRKRIFLGMVILVMIYFLTGVYSLQSGQHALILRFGGIVAEVKDSGINYHLPYPIETAYKVQVSKVQKVSIRQEKSGMFEEFTGDENLLLVDAAISYDVKDLTQYLFNQADITAIITTTGQMRLSQELAQMTVDDIMSTGKSALRLVMKDKLQATLDEMHTGIRIISVELTNISPPSSVSMAFKSVSDAREKKQEIIKEAEGYANSTVPKARGEAGKITSDAEASAQEIRKSATAKAESFEALLAEYQKNPEVTSRLKYLETLKAIANRSKVQVDANSKESIYYIEKEGK